MIKLVNLFAGLETKPVTDVLNGSALSFNLNNKFSNGTIFGYNPDVGVTDETVWSVGGVYAFPTAASVLNIVSTDAGDTNGGLGAWTVLIEGLDASYAEISETVTLNGLTPVQTTNSYLRVNNTRVVTGGTTSQASGNIGSITLTNQDPVTLCQIPAGFGVSTTAVYTVPAGKEVIVKDFGISVGQGKNVIGSFWARHNGTANAAAHKHFVLEAFEDAPIANIEGVILHSEKTDIWLSAVNGAGGVAVTAHLNYIIKEVEV